MKRVIMLLLSAAVLMTGCYGDEMFEQPQVVRVNPERGSTSVLPDSAVTVEFSRPMDTLKTNGEFSLSSGSGGIDGCFRWDADGRILTFTPKSPFSQAETYTIRITENAEDREGNDLAEEFLSVFFTGGDLGQPRIVSYTPAANSTGNRESCRVTVRFSEPVDMNSIYGGVTISPSVQGYYSGNGDMTEVTFTPLYGFSCGVTYSVSITNSVRDSAGNRLLAPASFSFTVGDDFIKPTLAAYQNLAVPLYLNESSIVSGAEKDIPVTIDFSEEMKTDNLESAVSIAPSVPFYISRSNVTAGGILISRGIINFTEKLVSGETYTLRISSTVMDLQGNPLDHDYRFVFRADGPGSAIPSVSDIGDLRGGDVIANWLTGEIVVLSLQGVSKLYDNIGVRFTAPMEPATLSIQAENVAGQGGSVSVVNIDWRSAEGAGFRILKFGLYGVMSGNTYRITIKGGKNGLKDINGNCLKEDFIQLVKF